MIKLPLSVIGALFLASAAFAQQSAPANPAPAKAAADCADLSALRKQLDADTGKLRDWAQLDRYREANANALHPAKDEIRVVFMGDFITDGWSKPQSGGFFPGKPYFDRGINGQTTPQMLVRFRPDVIDLGPQVVVILAGTNDIAGNTGPMTLEQTEDNLATMAELARAHGIRVVLSSVMPVRRWSEEQGRAAAGADEEAPAGNNFRAERMDQKICRGESPGVSGLFLGDGGRPGLPESRTYL